MTPTEMHIDALMEKIETLESKLASAREALEFYAETKNWQRREEYNETAVGEKQFIVAREALKELWNE